MRIPDEIKDLQDAIDAAVQAAEKFRCDHNAHTDAPLTFDSHVLHPLQNAADMARLIRPWKDAWL